MNPDARYVSDASDTDVINACKATGTDKFIEQLPANHGLYHN